MKRKSFEEFKVAVVDNIIDWLPERFSNAQVSLHVVTKNNNLKLTGLTIRTGGSNVVPTIYLEGFYEKYESGVEFNDILKKIAEARLEHEVKESFDIGQITDFEQCKDKIRPRLIGAEWNKELLKECPHILIEDLAVIFSIELGTNGDRSMSATVRNEMIDTWKMTADELYKVAVQNLSDFEEGTFVSINEIVAGMMLPELLEEYDGDREAAEQMLQFLIPDEVSMYVLSNKTQIYGASIILNARMMETVIEKLGNDFYVLPSSVHECLVVPADKKFDASDLTRMVREVNATEVLPEERLSNRVYRYTVSEGIKLA